MSTEEAFYLTCLLMMAAGFVLAALAWAVDKVSESAGAAISLVAIGCLLMGPLMALVGRPMSAGLIVLVALAGISAAGAVAMYVTAVKCECGARTPDLAGHYDYHHPTEECPR